MSIPVDGRAKTFGYLTEAEQAAWDHGVFQGQLDRELEAWADGVLARGGPFGGETGGDEQGGPVWTTVHFDDGGYAWARDGVPGLTRPPGCIDPWAEVKP